MYIVTRSIYYAKSESENKKTNKIVSNENCLGESPIMYKVRGIGFSHGM
jgi:hypothetical protein